MASYRSSRRSSGNRSGGNRRSARTGTRTRRVVSGRRRVSAGRRSVSGTKTVRLVIEQAAPTPQVVTNTEGRYTVPDNASPRKAKF